MTMWKTRVVEQMDKGAIDLYIYRELNNTQMQCVSSIKDGSMEVYTADKGTRMKVAISLDWTSQQMLQSISDGLFEFGIRPKQQPVLQNELTATKYHLEDIREMVSIVAGVSKGDEFGRNRAGTSPRNDS